MGDGAKRRRGADTISGFEIIWWCIKVASINHGPVIPRERSESRDLRFLGIAFNNGEPQIPPLGLKSSVGMTQVHEFPLSLFSIFAQVSRKGTVRLKTSAPGLESRSAQKYPSRSNW